MAPLVRLLLLSLGGELVQDPRFRDTPTPWVAFFPDVEGMGFGRGPWSAAFDAVKKNIAGVRPRPRTYLTLSELLTQEEAQRNEVSA